MTEKLELTEKMKKINKEVNEFVEFDDYFLDDADREMFGDEAEYLDDSIGDK